MLSTPETGRNRDAQSPAGAPQKLLEPVQKLLVLRRTPD